MDYWTSLIAHWAKKHLNELGYCEPDDSSIVRLVEVTTQDVAFLHYQEIDKACNFIIPRDGTLYKFLADKPHRIANCVFKVSPVIPDYNVEFLKVNNYGITSTTPEYMLYRNVALESIDNLESCSLLSENRDDLDNFQRPFPLDILSKVLRLFGL